LAEVSGHHLPIHWPDQQPEQAVFRGKKGDGIRCELNGLRDFGRFSIRRKT
jgi:hypothetical protein